MRIAYYRVSTIDQSIEAQRHAMGGGFDKEFQDAGVSGAVMAAERPGFSKLLEQVRKGDTVCVYAVDRLGRDALDVQATVRRLIRDGVTLDVQGLGAITGDVGELILAVLAQVADMERRRIRERTETGRRAARKALEATGKTHRGKDSLGRPKAKDAATVAEWKARGWDDGSARSIAETAKHFDVSTATVKRYLAAHRERDPLADISEKPLPEYVPVSPLSAKIAALRKPKPAPAPRRLDPDYDPLSDLD